MNNQQNIDDILKLLKSSYEDGNDGKETDLKQDKKSKNRKISQEEIKEKLKEQFMSDGDEKAEDTYESDDFSYNIDSDFLKESAANTENEKENPTVAKDEISENIEQDIEEDTEEAEEIIVDDATIINEENIEEKSPSEVLCENKEEIEIKENTQTDELTETAEEAETIQAAEAIEATEKTEETEVEYKTEESEVAEVEEIAQVEEVEEAETAEVTEVAEVLNADVDGDISSVEENYSENESQSEEELYSDGAGQLNLFDEESSALDEPANETVFEFENLEDENQISMDFGDTDADAETNADIPEKIVDIDDSELNIMYEVGDSYVVGKDIYEDRIEDIKKKNKSKDDSVDPSEAFAFEGKEFEKSDQADEVAQRYFKEKIFAAIRMGGCAVFTVLLFIFELLRAMEIRLDGFLDYMEYPSVYILVCTQLLVFSAIFAWRELFEGIKKAFTFKATGWSAVSVVLLFSIVSNVLMATVFEEENPNMFGTVASIYILSGLVCEFFAVCREIKCFEIYSLDEKKFTFKTKAKRGTAAEKMYRGGVDRKKKIYEPQSISFPKGYFAAVNLSEGPDVIVNYAITPSVIISVIAFVVCIITGCTAQQSLVAFMVTLCAILPICSFAIHTFPIYKTSSNLYKRTSAVAGEAMAKKYARCSYVVFNDLHLFKSASAKENGIVLCDSKNAKQTVEYLDTVYKALGGPMKNVFDGVSNGEHSIKIRRIARNGVEAVIDLKHSVILGNAEFLSRFGMALDGAEQDKEGILGFCIDSKLSAKLCLRYKAEPIFEMLMERLSENGIGCCIETYDPVINSKFVSMCRPEADNNVIVIHKNVNDYYGIENSENEEKTGLVVCSSRLKLIESAIWCKKLTEVIRNCNAMQLFMYIVALVSVGLFIGFGKVDYLSQYFSIISQLVCLIPVGIIMLTGFPGKDYFSVNRAKNDKIKPKEQNQKENEDNK